MSPYIEVSTRVSRPPSEVRNTFLDFDKFPEWHPGYKVTVLNSEKKYIDLQPGDKVEIVLGGMDMIFTIIENTPTSFLWKGSWRGLLTGANHMRFLDDKEMPGGTLLIQSETFTGVFAFLLSKWWPTWLGSMRKGFTEWYENFNGDLKARCEGKTP